MSFDGNDGGSQFEGVVVLNPPKEQNHAPCLHDMRVPELLRDMPYWLVWRFEQFVGEAKPRKIPYWPDGTRRHGTQGAPADLNRLTTFATAHDAAVRGGYEGVGFAHTAAGGIITLDFDNCVTDGVVRPDVLELVGGTYAEYSPSGNGVHAIFSGSQDVLGNPQISATADELGSMCSALRASPPSPDGCSTTLS